MPQTTQRFHSVSDSFHSRIDVWVFMMWPLWPSGSGHSGLCPPLPPPSGHKGHIIQPQTSILSWKLSLTSWKCWVVWVILLSNLLQPTRTIRMLPILSRNSSFRQKDPRKISFYCIKVSHISCCPEWFAVFHISDSISFGRNETKQSSNGTMCIHHSCVKFLAALLPLRILEAALTFLYRSFFCPF